MKCTAIGCVGGEVMGFMATYPCDVCRGTGKHPEVYDVTLLPCVLTTKLVIDGQVYAGSDRVIYSEEGLRWLITFCGIEHCYTKSPGIVQLEEKFSIFLDVDTPKSGILELHSNNNSVPAVTICRLIDNIVNPPF